MSPKEELYPNYTRAFELHELGMTLSLAETRCLSWPEIRPRLRSIWQDPQGEQLILRVQEMSLSEEESVELCDEIRHLSVIADQLHGRDRSTVDRRVLRLARCLPPSLLHELAMSELEHHRKLRRVGAYKALRDVGVTADIAPQLTVRYRETHDQELLTLIARWPDAVRAVDVEWLVTELDEQYWRTRVIEALIRTGDQRANRFVLSHPHEFVHAVGRAHAMEYSNTILDLVTLHPQNVDLLSITAWTFGILGNREGLVLVRELFEKEPASLPRREAPSS